MGGYCPDGFVFSIASGGSAYIVVGGFSPSQQTLQDGFCASRELGCLQGVSGYVTRARLRRVWMPLTTHQHTASQPRLLDQLLLDQLLLELSSGVGLRISNELLWYFSAWSVS